MSTRAELVQEVMKDREFVEKIAAMEDPVDVQAAFKAKGISFTIDEINQIAAVVVNNEASELSENELEAVAGGILAEIAIVAAGISFVASAMVEVNNARKAKGKKTIW